MPSRRCSVDGGVSEGRAATSVCCTDLQHSCLPPSGTTTTGTDVNTQDTLPAAQAGSSGRQLRTADETHVPSRRCSVDGGVSEGRAATSVCCTDLQHSCLPPSGTTTTTTATTGTDANTQDTLPAAQDGSSGRQTRRTCLAADAVSTVASVRGEQPRLCAAQTCSTLACRRVAPPPPPPPPALTPTPRTRCRQLRAAAQGGRRGARAQPPKQCRRWRQ